LSSQDKISYHGAAGSAAQEIYNSGKLKLSARCSAGGQPTVTAGTTVPAATLTSNGGSGSGDHPVFTADVTLTSAATEQRSLVYSEPGGQVVVAEYGAVGGAPYAGTPGCVVKGLAEKL
jgi:hypothetical protein